MNAPMDAELKAGRPPQQSRKSVGVGSSPTRGHSNRSTFPDLSMPNPTLKRSGSSWVGCSTVADWDDWATLWKTLQQRCFRLGRYLTIFLLFFGGANVH